MWHVITDLDPHDELAARRRAAARRAALVERERELARARRHEVLPRERRLAEERPRRAAAAAAAAAARRRAVAPDGERHRDVVGQDLQRARGGRRAAALRAVRELGRDADSYIVVVKRQDPYVARHH